MKYRKYSFPTEAAYKALLEEIIVQPIEGIEQAQIGFDAAYVICEQMKATYDEQGNQLTEAVLDPNYNVDIIWHTEEPKEFVEFQVWPSGIGQHIIGGWESAYEAARKVALNIVDEPILKE